MYTKLDDQRKANFIKAYLDKNPNCSRKNLIQDTVTTWSRLKNLEQQGYLTLPKYHDSKYTDKLIDRINAFIQSDYYQSDYHLRTTFKIGYDTLNKLKSKGLIKYGFYRKNT